MTTSATQKQSAAIRHRMQEIRNDLPLSMDVARAEVRNLTDWKHHVRTRPALVLPVVAAAAYWAIPKSKPKPQINHLPSSNGDAPPSIHVDTASPKKRSLMTGIFSALLTVALRSATSMATQHMSQMMSKPR